MKTKLSIGIKDLRHQPDHKTPKKFQLLQEYGTDPDNARLFLIKIRPKKFDVLSDGNKILEVKVI